jgi:hypothetical protein
MNFSHKFLTLFALIGSSAVFSSTFDLAGKPMRTPATGAVESGLQAGTAFVTEGAFSQINPARIFFLEKAAFEGSLLWDGSEADLGTAKNSSQYFGFSHLSFAFPMGQFGALGLGFWQKERQHFQFVTENSSYSVDGGAFEVTPTYSWGYDRFAIGFGWHQVLGASEVNKNYKVNDVSRLNVLNKISSSGGYPLLSAQWHGRGFDVAAYFGLEYEVNKRISTSPEILTEALTADSIITSSVRRSTWEVPDTNVTETNPWVMGLASTYQVSGAHWFALDASFSPEKKSAYLRDLAMDGLARMDLNSAYQVGLGYTWMGSQRVYDSYLRKIDLRTGASVGQLNVAETQFYQASVGAGFPLGHRGSQIDFSCEIGYRDPQIQKELFHEETYARIQFTLKGLGSWGEPSRRYR